MCDVFQLGRVDYQAAWDWQKSAAQARGLGMGDDCLFLLEHPHTYTLGSSGTIDHLLMSESERLKHGITVYHVDRGGGITYHGPGQLIGYPIIQLERARNDLRTDVVAYVRKLEEVLIESLAPFGIVGKHLSGYTGVWVDYKGLLQKIAAIGVKVTTRGVTFHGFALNINTDLEFFRGIIPCGIPDKPVISMQAILGSVIEMGSVIEQVIDSFGRQFHCQMHNRSDEWQKNTMLWY